MEEKLGKLLIIAKEINEKSEEYEIHIQLHTTNELEVAIFQIKPFQIVASASIDLKKSETNNIEELINFMEKNTRRK